MIVTSFLQRRPRTCLAVACLALACAGPASAQLSVGAQFDAGIGELVSAGYDAGGESVWVYGSFDADIRSYSSGGVFISSVPRPGESADDVDIDLAETTVVIAGTSVPPGTLLFVNGESSTAEIYAVNTATGDILATLSTAFGLSHVVGGAYHAGRGTFFLVQDRQPSGSDNDSVVAEVDATSGAVLNSFRTDVLLSGWTVNFGDVDVSAVTGNLYVVSSDETSILEIAPDGEFVQTHALPAGVTSLSGIAIDDTGCAAWVSGTGGDVWRLDGLCPQPDSDGDGLADSSDNCILVANANQLDADTDGIGNICDADFTQDCTVNFGDLGLLKGGFFGSDPVLDMNGDGAVNFGDLGLVKASFFQAPGPSGVPNDCED